MSDDLSSGRRSVVQDLLIADDDDFLRDEIVTYKVHSDLRIRRHYLVGLL